MPKVTKLIRAFQEYTLQHILDKPQQLRMESFGGQFKDFRPRTFLNAMARAKIISSDRNLV